MTRCVRLTLLFCLALALGARCGAMVPVPSEIASSHFIVSVNGTSTPVMHAALNLYFLNFEAHPHTVITVTADSDGFWDRGVEVQPWRLNIRPQRAGRTITFTLDDPAGIPEKISISRPGDFFSDSEMLYLFANPAESQPPTASTPGVRFYAPGVHHENIDAQSGDNIYLADGAVIFGSLNIWQADHVHVFGRGIIVYDGPQNPADDDGWMHKKNWHCIVMDQAHDISIEGITCVVRSRTWQIQMKDSRHILFDNIKVIGANAGNANADGMDWLGGGDTIVRDSFIRAADDVFALQSSWDGYGPVAFAEQGKPVTNIQVQGGVFSTSISNIVRAGWPEKNFEGGNFTMQDADVIHMGLGGCGIPFALMELWATPHGRGQSAGFHFNNIRMEDWYSLTQLEEPVEGVGDVSFNGVMGLESPSLVPSTLEGSIHDVSLTNTVLAGAPINSAQAIPLDALDGAAAPTFPTAFAEVQVKATQGLIRPRDKVHFEAITSTKRLQFHWFFGDGERASGRRVKHRFPDTDGTLLDGSGRFRVLLEAQDAAGHALWTYTPVIVSQTLQPAHTAVGAVAQPGLGYSYAALTDGVPSTQKAQAGIVLAPTLKAVLDVVPQPPSAYTVTFQGDLQVPADGGYTFALIANEQASIEVDGVPLAQSLPPIAQVCGMAGSAARLVRGVIPLQHGLHHVRVAESHHAGKDDFQFLWQGPGFALQPVASANWSHE
jgi:hypothetical protein